MNEKERILSELEDEFNRWEQLLAGMSAEQINAPNLPADLSLKDVMAHLWAWQQRSVARLEAALEEREPVFPRWPENLDPNSEEDLDAINAWIYDSNHDRSWDEVYADWRAGFRRFMDLGRAIAEQDLLTPGRYAWIWGHPLSFIMEASYGHHHEEHYEPLVAWLRQHGGAPESEKALDLRKVILFNMMSLDGFFEGPGHDINWHSVDEEFNEFAIHQLDQAGGLLFGRVTYELMESYWPTQQAIGDDPEVAARMNSITKYVFSRGLEKAGWINTTLVRGDAVEELHKMKQQPGRDLYLFGSGNLARSLIQAGIIDEFRVMISPILLGAGTPLFQDVQAVMKLQLVESRTFKNGNVLVVYREET